MHTCILLSVAGGRVPHLWARLVLNCNMLVPGLLDVGEGGPRDDAWENNSWAAPPKQLRSSAATRACILQPKPNHLFTFGRRAVAGVLQAAAAGAGRPAAAVAVLQTAAVGEARQIQVRGAAAAAAAAVPLRLPHGPEQLQAGTQEILCCVEVHCSQAQNCCTALTPSWPRAAHGTTTAAFRGLCTAGSLNEQ